ncbi:Holliday junction recognition protein [Porphyrio hochstetteri]
MAFCFEERLLQSNARFVASIESILERYNHPFEDDLLISMETLTYSTPRGSKHWGKVSSKQIKKWKEEVLKHNGGSQRNADEERDALRRKLEDIYFKNLYADDGKIRRKVQVDVIVQERARKIPKWITIEPPSLKGHYLSSPVQKLIGNQAAVCRKKVKSNQCSSSRRLELEISPNTITKPRHRPSPEMNDTCHDCVLENYQSSDEECSCNNLTLADTYPAMVEILRRGMTMVFWRRELKPKELIPKLNVTVNKGRGCKHLKLKQGPLCICRSRSKDIQNQTYRSENRKLHDDKCSTGNSSGLAPSSYIDTKEIDMDLILELDFFCGRGQEVSKQTVSSNMARRGETFMVKDEVQTTVPESFIPSTARSTALHLVKESKVQKTDLSCSDTSGLCSPACSSYRSRNTSTPALSPSLARVPNISLVKLDPIISERLLAFRGGHSLSSLHASPSQMPQKHEDSFDKLYNSLCSQEIQRPLTLTRPLPNSWNLGESGLVKNTLNFSVKSDIDYDREFDRIYEELCSEDVPKLPGIQGASSVRKYEGIQMSETVNALVNSSVQTLSATPRAKRLGNFQNDFISTPVKRLKSIPELCFLSPKRQQISHRRNVNLQTVGMDFLSTYNGSNPSFFDSHSCQSQDFGFHASSDERVLSAPGTSLQESGIAGPHSGWPREMKNSSSPGSARKHHQRVCRKLSYTDGKDQNSSKTSDNFLVASHQGTFMNCCRGNTV